MPSTRGERSDPTGAETAAGHGHRGAMVPPDPGVTVPVPNLIDAALRTEKAARNGRADPAAKGKWIGAVRGADPRASTETRRLPCRN